MLVPLVVSPTILSAHAITPPNYVPAAMPGQFAQYEILKNTCHSSLPQVCQFFKNSLNDTTYAAINVVEVSSPKVTLQLITIYKNGTGAQQGALVDVATGSSNITAFSYIAGDFFVLAGGLSSPNPIWNSPSAPKLNSTSPEMVLGAMRTINFLNTTVTGSSTMGTTFSESSGFAFDKSSGFLIEVNLSLTILTGGVTTELDLAIRMIDNNLWRISYIPDFRLNTNPTTVNITGSASGTSTIMLTRLYGFSATVILKDTPSSSNITCSLSSNSLAMGSSDTSTLSCAGSPGTYTVDINGNAGFAIHSTSVTVDIAAGPDFTITNNGPVSFQTGSSGTATITIGATNGYSSTTTLEVNSTPSGLTCNLSSATVYGGGSVSLTCSGQPGTYTVTVKATGGGTSHSTPTTVTVNSAPASPQPASELNVPLIAGGAVAVLVVLLLALLLLRRRPKAPAMPSGNAAQA